MKVWIVEEWSSDEGGGSNHLGVYSTQRKARMRVKRLVKELPKRYEGLDRQENICMVVMTIDDDTVVDRTIEENRL